MSPLPAERLAQITPIIRPAPRVARVVQNQWEYRVERPGNPWCDNLMYVGRNSYDLWHVKPHYHDHFELCYIDEGHCWFTVNHVHYQVSKGDLFLTRPGEVHWGAASADLPFHLYYAGYSLDQLVSLEPIHYSASECRVVHPETPLIVQLFQEIICEIQDGRSGFSYMVNGLFTQLIVAVLRCFQTRQQKEGDMQSSSLTPLVQRSIELLHSDSTRNLEELSTVLYVSKTHLAHEFRRQIGVTVGKYAHLLRMNRARLMLRDTADDIGSIADKLGFASIQSFSGAFKKATGQSPLEFRRQVLSAALK